eukprot:4154956-Pleurochrysis_carterae.AAC.1
MWALAKANLLWVLHASRLRMPGRIDPVPLFAAYRTDAVQMRPRCGKHRASIPAAPAARPATASNDIHAANVPPPEDKCSHPKNTSESPL